MKLKQLKKILDRMSKEELNKELIYNSDNYAMSGHVGSFVKSRSDLYNTGEDDPATLYTKSKLKENGFDKEDIEQMDIEISKGDFYITF